MKRALFILGLWIHGGVLGCVGEAKAFLAALSPEQLKAAHFEWGASHRKDWDWVPGSRQGVVIKTLKPAQIEILKKVVACALSGEGATMVNKVLTREDLLGKIELAPAYRDSALYYLAVYGTPSPESIWSFRFEGHHLSVNAAFQGNKLIATTPLMVGANPSRYEGQETLLHKNVQLGVKLFSLLNKEQAEKALETKGVSSEALPSGAQKVLRELVSSYLAWIRPDYRQGWEAQMAKDKSPIFFAWWGNPKGEKSYLFRVSHPRLFLEHNATQDGGNHIHTFLRDPLNDFRPKG